MVGLLVALGRGERHHGETARVEHFGDTLDRATLPCRVPAFKNAEYGDLVLEDLEFQFAQAHLCLADLLIVSGRRKFLDGHLLKHGRPPLSPLFQPWTASSMHCRWRRWP